MALRDDALGFLRQVFGRERAERDRAESPSADAEKQIPTSMFSVWGREDVGGLLTVSQNLMDRYADYEQMDDYPDINCLGADTTIYVVEGSVIRPFRIHDLAAHGGGVEILAYDAENQKLIKTLAENPRITGNKQQIVEVGFSNGEKIKCTPDHKFLTVEHGYINCSDMVKGTSVVSAWTGFDTKGISTFLHPISGTIEVTQSATPAGEADVYDVSTTTHNFVANGAIVHNSANHYFTNDATQPDIDTGRTVWVHSKDEAIKDMTDTLLNKRLKIEDDIWSMVYTTVKMGNNFEEILVTDNGVVGLNSLPVPTMRRVEQSNGSLIGYVQDITGKFTQDAGNLRGMLAGTTEIPNHVALFEEWQVLHTRLRGAQRRSPYGFCIPADGKVWTTKGLTPINEVKNGDRVVNRHAGMLRTTQVVNTFNSGKKEVFRLKTTHREVRASKNHPFLVKCGESNQWNALENLKAGDEIVVATTMPQTAPEQPLGIKLDYLTSDTEVVLTARGSKAIKAAVAGRKKHGPRDVGLHPIFKRLGITRKVADRLLDGGSAISWSKARDLLCAVGLDMFDGAVSIKRRGNFPTLSDFVTPTFAKLYGFLIGDGWNTKNGVHFARGDNEKTNQTYEELLSNETGLEVVISPDKTTASVHSTELVRIFDSIGWIQGAHEKRVPLWLYGQSTEIREAFLEGFVDADGWTSDQYNKTRYHTELCNKELVEGLKAIIDGLGWTCGNVRVRAARTSKIAAGTIRYADGAVLPESEIKSGPSNTITWHKTPLGNGDFAHEKIISIESEGYETTYDIQVADTDHNFVCNGIIVHNSVVDGGRWIWKRLLLLEDAMLIYKLCLRGDSQIWTPDGRTAIKDLEEGDEVYSYTKEDKLRKSKVCYKKHNGQDTIYRVFSDHREIFANKTHPVLVEEIIGQGSGKPRARFLKYVEVQNLEPGKHRLVTPKKNVEDWEEIKLRTPELHSKARLSSPDRVIRKQIYPDIAKEVGVHHYRARDFFNGEYELKTETAVALLEANGYGVEHLDVEEHWGGDRGLPVKGVTVPDAVDEDFARWWGFMLGDGFITTRNHKVRPGHTKGHVTQNEVGFALGDDDQVNEDYKALFEQYVPEAKLVNDQDYRLGAYTFTSCKFAEFMLLNGFIPGAHNNRVPEWVFRASPEIKLAMIRGLADADAHIIPRKEGRKTRFERARFEMCNEQLLEDVRELAMQLGLVVTMVRSRFRKGGRTIKGSTQPLKDTTSYCLDVTFKQQPMTEMLRGVEEIGTDDIWDIGVEDEEHNFVADGVVLHNTRAPARFAFYIDVTDIPSDKVDSFLRKAKQDLRKQKLVNPRTQRLDMRFNPMDSMEDFFIAVRENRELARVEVLQGPDYQATEDVEYFQRKLHGVLKVPRSYLGQDDAIPPRTILCLTGDTKVPLLDGRTLTMRELSDEYRDGGEFHVYSSAPDGSVTVGRAYAPQVTKPNAEVWEVTLDNGRSVRGTPDHPFMLRDGKFCRLDELIPGSSLMPLYRRDSKKSRDRIKDYDMYRDPKTGKWQFTHRMVMEWKQGKATMKGHVVHHEDFDRRNNAPDNLKDMIAEEHLQLHRVHADKTINRPDVREKAIENSRWWTGSEENKELCRRNLDKARAPGGGQHAWCKSDKHRALKSKQMKEQWSSPDSKLLARTQTDEFRAASSNTMKMNHELGLVDNRGPKNRHWRADAAYRRLVEVTESFRCTAFSEITKWSGYSSCLIYRLIKEQGLTFEQFANAHMPFGFDPGGHKRRRAEKSRRLASAQVGPDNHKVVSVRKLDVREDCYDFVVEGTHNYALDAGVFVHNSFEDVRAARVTMGIQREMKNTLRRLVQVDLAARGVNPFNHDLQVMMTVPSGIYELAHNEIKNARADFATRVQPFVSMRYIQERILKLSEDEIESIEREREDDAKKEAEQQQQQGGPPGPGGPPMPMPPEAGGGPVDQQPPGNVEVGPPPGVAGRPNVAAEWKRYDAARRLEERRHSESLRRDQEIQDTMRQVVSTQKDLAHRLDQSQQFFRELKHTYMTRNGNGKIITPSKGRGHRR